MPYEHRSFEIEFDFIDHQLYTCCSDGAARQLALEPRFVANFYHEVLRRLHELGLEAKIWPMPVELEKPIRFTDDTGHASYDPEAVHLFWRALTLITPILTDFRRGFTGKCSPAYCVPAPEGFAEAPVRPDTAYYSTELGEFLLPYEAVRTAPEPAAILREFLQSTYDAGADLAGWDRAALERA